MSSSKQDFTLYSACASKWASAATLDLLPEALLEKDLTEGTSFCIQFRVTKPLNHEFVERLQERMILLRNSNDHLQIMEMVPKSAKELFLHHKQPLLVEEMNLTRSQTVYVSKIGERYDLIRTKFEQDFEKMHFIITHFDQVEDEKSFNVHVFGQAAPSANDLKEALKKSKAIEKYHHEHLGAVQNLFLKDAKGWLLLPKGVEVLNRLKAGVEKIFEENGFAQVQFSNSKSDLKTNFEKLIPRLTAPKIFLYETHFSEENSHFKNELDTSDLWIAKLEPKEIEKECISYLKFYLQIIKILGFSYELKCDLGPCPQLQKSIESALNQSGLEYQLEKSDLFKIVFELRDRYDRKCFAPFWTIEKDKGHLYIRGSFCSSYEKLLGWLLEDRQGELPKEWNPYLLKIISLKQGEEFAKRLYDYFNQNNIKTSLDISSDKLNVRLKKAYLEKVPHIVIIGSKEQEEEKLTVKMQKLNEECVFTKEELLEHLLKEEHER